MVKITYPSRDIVEIEYNGQKTSFYCEIGSPYSLVFAEPYEGLSKNALEKGMAQMELMQATLEHCRKQNEHMLFWVDSKGNVLDFVTSYLKQHSLCPKCGGEYIGVFDRWCKRCEGSNFFFRNVTHICFLGVPFLSFLLVIGILYQSDIVLISTFLWLIVISAVISLCYYVILLVIRKHLRTK